MASNRSKLDLIQIHQMCFDEELKASRVSLADADIQIELNADDGDSVISKKQTIAIPIVNGMTIDLSKAEKVCLFGANTVDLKIVIDEVEINAYTLSKGIVKEVCLTTVVLTLSDLVTPSYLMVQ